MLSADKVQISQSAVMGPLLLKSTIMLLQPSVISWFHFLKKYKQLSNWHRTKIVANHYWAITLDTMLNTVYIHSTSMNEVLLLLLLFQLTDKKWSLKSEVTWQGEWVVEQGIQTFGSYTCFLFSIWKMKFHVYLYWYKQTCMHLPTQAKWEILAWMRSIEWVKH